MNMQTSEQHGWHVSSMDGKNHFFPITEEILSSLPFWEETQNYHPNLYLPF